MKNKLSVFIKGFVVGGTMLVPGVSGGTMAMILGIYEDLVKSVSNFFQQKKKSLIFLAIFCIGAFGGMAIFAKNILSLLNSYHMPVMYFFIGAVAGGIPMIIKSCGLKRLSLSTAIFPIIGAIAVIGISSIPQNIFHPANMSTFYGSALLFFAGFVAAIALILPGISVSYVLLILGIYQEIIKAFDQLNIMYLAILGLGLLVGIISTTRILEKAMTKYKRATYLIILGFVIGSIFPVFPGAPSGINLFICPVCFIAGFAIIELLYLLDK